VKILVVGGGGREHALTWKLANDSSRPTLFCAPGNAGTATLATNIPISAEDIDGLVAWAIRERPDLTIVGPEAPLCAGLVDRLAGNGLAVFGPCQQAAQLEGSKRFAKEIMEAAGVPTARATRFSDAASALNRVKTTPLPVVIKADGLAAGKGVYICQTRDEAERAVRDIMVDRVFGDAGAWLLFEECLQGEEASILALVDGETVVMLASSQDHKRVFNNDLGPNTGGMGAYSPAPVVKEAMWPAIRDEVFGRVLAELRRRGIDYRGVLYAGLMMTADGPKVLEFNCRFGDPETQVVLPRIDGDLLPALVACARGGLREDMIRWRREACVSVVMASGGYPGPYEKGKLIEGLGQVADMADLIVFHAGTSMDDAGHIVTDGGRVLNVTALGGDLQDAVKRAYLAITHIRFDQSQYRTDIASKALCRQDGERVNPDR
jgi:phosphoribosylamine--glycine ligase